MQASPCKRFFSQFKCTRRTAASVEDIEELTLVELLEADNDDSALNGAQKTSSKDSVPRAQAYVNRLLVRIKAIAGTKNVRLTPGLSSHSFRRGGAMHANDGSLAENWIIERGGWQLDRVNKAFGYMLGTTQADQQVSRVLSGWRPKEGARLPALCSLDQPVLARARILQAALFSSTVAFDDAALNIDSDVADVLVAVLLMHYPDMLLLSDSSAFITRIREAMAAKAIGEAEVLAWSATIRRSFDPPASQRTTNTSNDQLTTMIDFLKQQSEQVKVLILQNKRLDERLLAVETQLCHTNPPTNTNSGGPEATPASLGSVPAEGLPVKQVRLKKKSSQTLAAIWYQWFTAEPRVYASKSVKKTSLYEFRHIAGYMMLFLPSGFGLDAASSAFKSEVLNLGTTAQDNALAFLKAHVSSAVAAGTALKALRKLHKAGKLDRHITEFHERVNSGNITDPTPPAALPSFIRLKP